MNYYKDTNNQVLAYDNEQVSQGYGSDLIPITEAEKDALLAPTAEQLAEQEKAEALAYLNSTDWYYARLAETGKAVPQDVLDKRSTARGKLND